MSYPRKLTGAGPVLRTCPECEEVCNGDPRRVEYSNGGGGSYFAPCGTCTAVESDGCGGLDGYGTEKIAECVVCSEPIDAATGWELSEHEHACSDQCLREALAVDDAAHESAA